MPGTVYLVGAGPGAPDLLTLRTARLLERADVVFYDALVHEEIVALARGAQHVAVGKRCGRHSSAQRFINKRLVEAARKHAVVVRLKGGDPLLFGRAQEEIDALRAAGIAVEIVPGVTSALAACAELGVSLTQRGVSRTVTLATPRVGAGHDPSEWTRAVGAADSAAIYMGSGLAAELSHALQAAGLAAATPVMVVENASLPAVRRLATTLGELPRAVAGLGDGPAIILLGAAFLRASAGAPIGEVVAEFSAGARSA